MKEVYLSNRLVDRTYLHLSVYLSPSLQRALWEQQDASDRKLPFVPTRFSSLRQVPAFPRFLHERFERCLDLYLCPRQRKMRVSSQPITAQDCLSVRNM